MAHNAVLTIDAEGRITDCNQEANELLGWRSETLEGHPVTEVVPELPFSPNTPGYNLAFAVFHAANGVWMRRMARLADGRELFVDMALSSMLVNFKRHITLSFRPSLIAH
jgi:PAS domain S-box-containing protein